MYVRSHIENVSGTNKYIYINTDDATKKKYIRENKIYYPIKKYKGIYSLQKKRGGAPPPSSLDASIDVKLHLYGKVSKDAQIFDTNINLNNIVLNTDDTTYKSIIKDNKIYIFNKGSDLIGTIKGLLNGDDSVSSKYGIIYINHYVIIKNNTEQFKVYYKKISEPVNIIIDKLLINYKSFYNIIYKRNNKIDSNSNPNQGEYFLTIFSITDDVNTILPTDYQEYTEEQYNKLYNSTLDKLNEIYR
jgi:hypothetical protein